jgi:hypothetical protein
MVAMRVGEGMDRDIALRLGHGELGMARDLLQYRKCLQLEWIETKRIGLGRHGFLPDARLFINKRLPIPQGMRGVGTSLANHGVDISCHIEGSREKS